MSGIPSQVSAEFIRVAKKDIFESDYLIVRAIFDLYRDERLSQIPYSCEIEDVLRVDGQPGMFDVQIIPGTKEEVESRLKLLPQIKIVIR